MEDCDAIAEVRDYELCSSYEITEEISMINFMEDHEEEQQTNFTAVSQGVQKHKKRMDKAEVARHRVSAKWEEDQITLLQNLEGFKDN